MLLKKCCYILLVSFLMMVNINFHGYAIEEQVIIEQNKKELVTGEQTKNEEAENSPDAGIIENYEYSSVVGKLRNKNTKIRLDAVKELSIRGTEEVVSFLVNALEDSEIEIRLESIVALEKIGGEEAIRGIVEKGLKGNNEKVRLAAINSLVKISGRSAISSLKKQLLIEKNSRIRFHIINLFAIIGNDDVIPILVKCLRDSNLKIQLITIKTLALIGTPLAVSALINCLENEENKEEVSIAIVNTLGIIHSRDAVPVLIRMAAFGGKSEISAAAVESLGIIGDKRAMPVLNELLFYGNVRFERSIKEAISKILKINALIKLKKRKNLRKKENSF